MNILYMEYMFTDNQGCIRVIVEMDKQVLLYIFRNSYSSFFFAPFHKQIIAFIIQYNCFDFLQQLQQY
jgi:hypothetical protein